MTEHTLGIVLIARESTSLRLRRTLNSALSQTYEPKTVWVVNANPSDNAFTLGLLEDLKPYPNVNLLPVPGQGTEFYYRNKAMERIDSAFIAFMSDIDVWEPDKAARQIAQLVDDPRAGAAFCNALVLRETPHGIVGSAMANLADKDPQVWMLKKTVSFGSQVMYRADALQLIGGFDQRLARYGDLDALLRMIGMRKVLQSGDLAVKAHIPPLQDLRAKEYEDNRYLLQKHLDFFLVHKRTAFEFMLMLARQAMENREFLMMIAYLARAVLKQPVRAVLLLAGRCVRWVGTLLFKGVHGLSIANAIRRLKRDLRRGAEPRLPEPVIRQAGDSRKTPPAALDKMQEYEFVRYAGMKFMRNQNLEYVKVPDYVTVIPRGMFFGCKMLKTVTIPNTVTRIEANAFQGCEQLKTVRFAYGSALESIGDYAFAGCVSLSDIELSNSLTTLGKGVFAGCANLRSIIFVSLRVDSEGVAAGFPSSLRVIPGYAFAGCASLPHVKFEPGSMLERVDKSAFFGCTGLETIRITGVVQKIGARAFMNCGRLGYLDMQAIDSIKEIGRHAFENCVGLNNLYIPYAIRYIRPYTFSGCTGLKRVKIPQNVKRVQRNAFARCDQLQNVTLMDETTYYRRSSFPRQTRVEAYKTKEANRAGRSVPS